MFLQIVQRNVHGRFLFLLLYKWDRRWIVEQVHTFCWPLKNLSSIRSITNFLLVYSGANAGRNKRKSIVDWRKCYQESEIMRRYMALILALIPLKLLHKICILHIKFWNNSLFMHQTLSKTSWSHPELCTPNWSPPHEQFEIDIRERLHMYFIRWHLLNALRTHI